MFSLVSNATLTDFANCIHVEYSTVTVTEDIIDVTDTEVRLDAGQSVDLAIDYTSEIAYPSAVTNNAAVRLTNFDSGTNSCSCTVTNTSATAQTAVITVSGNAIEIKSNKITKRDEVSIELYGTVAHGKRTCAIARTSGIHRNGATEQNASGARQYNDDVARESRTRNRARIRLHRPFRRNGAACVRVQ